MGPSLRSSSSSLSATSKPANNEEEEEEQDMTKTIQNDGPKTKKQKRGTGTAAAAAAATESAAPAKTTKMEKKVKGKPKKADQDDNGNNNNNSDEESQLPPAKKKKAATAKAPMAEESEMDAKKKPAAKKSPPHQVLTEREDLPKLWDTTAAAAAEGSYTFKIASWNVAGLRAMIKKTPTVLADLVIKHNLDCLCLQETKLNDDNLDDPKLNIPRLEEHGYEAHYSCSTAKKGYSGTAVFVRKRNCSDSTKKPAAAAAAGTKKKKQSTLDSFVGTASTKTSGSSANLPIDAQLLVPDKVSYKMGVDKHDNEGRIIVVDFPLFTMVNVYVPNSGQKLERLDYRTKEWDKDLLAFMQSRQQQASSSSGSNSSQSRPVLWCGDLNVAHTNLEVWNDGAKHLSTQAGVTAQERASFQAQLDAGFVDAFRRLHPTAQGHYSYWSQRAGNRGPNKGLRLDYFVCDPSMFLEASNVVVRDSYMIYDQVGSDHCPVVLELTIKP